jgi:phage gpG-like protein
VIEVTVPDAEKLERDLGMTRAQLLADLKREVRKVATDVSATVKDRKLSGQVLKVQTGRLRRSVNYRTTETETGIEALVGTNVSYGRAHEFGFSGEVGVKAHLRRVKQAFGRKLKKAKQVSVRAHSRTVNLPERSFLRSSLREMRTEIDSRIARVVADSIARRNGGAS